ncbi:DUF1396 domain-containing protein [Streptomyces sp. A7024]|uniref:DUF1396 domain-containing protein n=1 Tax=Streptomyces coryli TaxID=1128680 RepID=A0A6G4TVP2_9ACTN|nr:DUF1396 domain-containing protein [Streptomyces coryli]NGN63842.1 DUF1396 domain-containing protein [Streptomyces coryli]
MSNALRVRASAALLSAVLLGGAVACGSDGGTGSGSGGSKAGGTGGKPAEVTPAVAIKKAVTKQRKIDSMTFRMRGTAPGEGTFTGDAAMTRKPAAMRMKMQISGGAEGGRFELRMVDEAMYMSSGEAAAAEMDGKRWMKFDLSELGADGGKPGAGSALGGSAAQEDPSKDVEDMLQAEGLKKVGEEKIDGVATTHYSGTLTLDQLEDSIKEADAAERERKKKKLKEFRELGLDQLSMDMWIDENDMTKQFRTSGKTNKGPMDVTMTFGEINKPVSITAPPAAEVMDLSKEMGGES